jgi:ferredoxin
MSNLNARAKELLDNKTVQVVIGYENGTNGNIRPAFITDPQKTSNLVYNEKCVQNLAVYLTKPEVKKIGRPAIVATLPVMRSILVLISELQVNAEELTVLGISGDGSFLEFADISVMQAYVEKSELANPSRDQEIIEKLKKLSPAEKFEWWKNELSKCIRCYACRQACPLCYCTRCTVEVNQPQWIPVKSTPGGNLDWHVLRAMHLAGRCISCGECGRACPVGIPCHLLTMYLSDSVYEHFKVHSGTSAKMASVMSTFDPNDKDNFII